MQAFRGDEHLKQETIRRVSGHMQAGELLPNTRTWDERAGKGSAGGCAVHDADLGACERLLGVPEVLVAIMEALYGQIRVALWSPEGKLPAWVSAAEASAAQAFPIEWFGAISPGADLTPVARQFTVWLLSDSEHGAVVYTKDSRAQSLLQAVAAAHNDALPASDEVHWASLRGRALALRDNWPETTYSIDAWAASVAETACWPLAPRNERVAEEALEMYSRYAFCKAAALVGWTPEAEEQTHALREEVQQAHAKAVPKSTWRNMEKQALIAALQKAAEPYEGRLKADIERREPYERELAKQRWLIASACRETFLRLAAAAHTR